MIDLLLHSLGKMKRSGGISTITFNIPDNTISVVDNEDTLIVRPINYDFLSNNKKIISANRNVLGVHPTRTKLLPCECGRLKNHT